MLGRLARWLRVLGYDTAYDAHIEDGLLARRASEEDRIVLTRDLRLPVEHKLSRYLIVADDRPLRQLRQVVEAFALSADRGLFTRCTRCNAEVRSVAADQIADAVPARVLREQSRFVRCSGCRRVYWQGSHTERMRRSLERALD